MTAHRGRGRDAPILDKSFGFDRNELACLRKLTTPEKVQSFLDDVIGYNKEPDGETCRSPRRVLRDRVAHCMEGALMAAAALRVQGRPPLIVDLEAVRDDDHLLAVFRDRGHWGAVAKSNYAGLRFREPVYRTLRELVMSYYEHYYNLAGEKTLRRFIEEPELWCGLLRDPVTGERFLPSTKSPRVWFTTGFYYFRSDATRDQFIEDPLRYEVRRAI